MKQKFTILIAAVMLLTMINLPGAAWATTDQVTSQTATNNGEYVIAIYYNGDYYALPKASTMSSATTYAGTKLTLNSLGKVNTSDASDITWKLVENSNTSGQFYIQQTINNTTYYLYKNGTTSSTNYNIKTVTSGQHYWTFAQQSNQYKTYTVKSERGSACQYLTNTANTSTFSVRGSTNSYITLLAVGDATPCTVTLGDDNTQLTETSAGAGVTLPSRSDVSPYTFEGWITDNITNETTTAPATIIPAGTYYPTSNITLYPVYTRIEGGGTTTEWHLTELADADDGVYALLSSGNKAFNGTISNGHGQSTADAFVFSDGVATTAPTGLCEITLVGVTGGYKMFNSSNGYLYGAAASVGNLAWHESETSYWSYTSSNWIYNTNTVYLRSYNDTFRTYGKASNNEIKLAKKISVSSATTYYISVVSTGEPTIVASNVEILYSATNGSIEYIINDDPDPAGTLTAAIKAGTTSTIANLVFGTITNDEVPFTCDANNAFSARTDTITLTYTYNTDQTVTTDVTITQAAAPTPTISVGNVEITYNATNGDIAYTIYNPADGTLTASTTSDWLTLPNTFASPITFTCNANPTYTARTATVTLTYTYNTNQTVVKDVTVTQAANMSVFDNISSINSVGTSYRIKGTIVAINSKGFVLGDGTGYVQWYKGNTHDYETGNKVIIYGTTGSYGNIIQFTNTATIEEVASSNYNGAPGATAITAIPDYTSGNHLSTYLQFEGELSKSDSKYFITLGEAQIQISYPTTAQSTALDALVGKTVAVNGYFAGINSDDIFTVMLESAEEVIGTDPTISVSLINLSGFTYLIGNGPSASQTVSVSGANLTANISLSLGENSNYEM